jgi:competence protein ComEA
VLALPEALIGARLRSARGAVAGMLVLVLVAAAGFGVRVLMARAESRPQVVTPGTGGDGRPAALASDRTTPAGFATGAGAPATSGSAGPGGSAAPGTIVVHVVGQVKRPGVVELAMGSRVRDAIAKAGGARSGADLAVVNLARVLADGEQLHIPKPGETPPGPSPPGGASGEGSGEGSPGGAGTGGGAGGGLVNLNTADAATLEELPGVGPVLAQRIIDWRTEHGRFASVDELAEVSGIGEKIFAQLQPKVTV